MRILVISILTLCFGSIYAQEKPWGDKYPSKEKLIQMRKELHIPVTPNQITHLDTHRNLRILRECASDFYEFVEMFIRDSNIKGFGYNSSIRWKKAAIDTVIFKSPVENFRGYKCLGWEARAIGVHNNFMQIEAYALISHKRNLELQLENLKLKRASADSILEVETEYKEAIKRLDYFLATTSYSD